MLNITLVCVGKLKESYLKAACAEYQKRMGATFKLDLIEVGECAAGDNPSPAEITRALQKEGVNILARIPQSAYVIALCIEGEALSSEALAAKISSLAVAGKSQLAFIIGGSWGLCEQVKTRADFRLSLSKMTFPHQLTRVLLLEQLYRAGQIAAGGKYHK